MSSYQDFILQKAYINGKWQDAKSGERFAVFNPHDQLKLADVALCGELETKAAIRAAQDALPAWRALAPKERMDYLLKWYELIEQHADSLAELVVLESGKPINEARGEVAYGNSYIKWFAAEAMRAFGSTAKLANERHMMVIKQPIGVCAAITPWNFPMAMITRKISPALAAGCTVVLKPAEDTPLSALALAKLADEAGLPAGVINVVTGDPKIIGKTLTESPIVRKLSFTGSTDVGRLLMTQCGDTVKRMSLELGGNAPFIIFDDADLDKALDGLMAAKFRNSGQTCVCANRIFIHDAVYDELLPKLIERVQALEVGNGMDESTQVASLINHKAVDKVQQLVEEAVRSGAVLCCGGQRLREHGYAYAPTVLTGITEKMHIFSQEIFGPVCAIIRFSDEADVIRMANHTRYGLAAYFYSDNLQRALRVAEGLEFGVVGVNAGIVSSEVAPFGGVKMSGIGREGSQYGLDDYLNIKYINL